MSLTGLGITFDETTGTPGMPKDGTAFTQPLLAAFFKLKPETQEVVAAASFGVQTLYAIAQSARNQAGVNDPYLTDGKMPPGLVAEFFRLWVELAKLLKKMSDEAPVGGFLVTVPESILTPLAARAGESWAKAVLEIGGYLAQKKQWKGVTDAEYLAQPKFQMNSAGTPKQVSGVGFPVIPVSYVVIIAIAAAIVITFSPTVRDLARGFATRAEASKLCAENGSCDPNLGSGGMFGDLKWVVLGIAAILILPGLIGGARRASSGGGATAGLGRMVDLPAPRRKRRSKR